MFDRRTIIGSLLAIVPAAARSRPAKAAALNIYKSPYCGCCTKWIDHVRNSGFMTNIREMEDVTPIANKLGVPDKLRSCHTAEINGQFVEGHVPASDIRRMLRERPSARGIAVPGMPAGSPGMEQGDRRDPFETLIVERSGKVGRFARHNQGRS